MLSDILEKTFLQNTVLDYLLVIGWFLAGVIAIKIVNGIVMKRLKAWSAKSTTTIDDFLLQLLENKLVPLLYFGVLALSFRSLTLAPGFSKGVSVIVAIVLTYFGLRILIALLTYSLDMYWVKKEVEEGRQKSLKGVITILKVLVWAVGITFLLDNLGFKISTVVAGLGIGGIAVALAAQTILGDLFSYFVIFFDRPFEVGDFIIIGDYMGSIEHIGIKTTRVRSLGGEQLVFSNTDLTNSRIRNYKRMERRRIVFKLGVVYQTSLDHIREVPGIIKNVIENTNDTVFDRAHFSSFGAFSLDIEAVYYVLSSDYNKYMDIQQSINLEIKEAFENRGIEFAYPTQTLFVEKGQENE
ncbi:MAG: mechanosensitive ion channel protein MscS [Nitrospira bacterium SG8_35_4]|nr:MAG: mechanosensitive ion channel protein MscS [Nitrospira bacterium SG8_35_4]